MCLQAIAVYACAAAEVYGIEVNIGLLILLLGHLQPSDCPDLYSLFISHYGSIVPDAVSIKLA